MKPSSLLIANILLFQRALEAFALSDLFCTNDASFRFSYNGKTRDCQWIIPQSDEVTTTLCRDMTIRSSCLHSCGLCCEDNIFFRIQTLDGEFKTCSWIAKDEATKLQYCNLKQNGISLKEVCAATCNNCEPFIPLTEAPSGIPTASPTILPPTAIPSRSRTERPSLQHHPTSETEQQEQVTHEPSVAPSFEPCTDNEHFVFLLQTGGQRNCAWITMNPQREQERKKYCQDEDVFYNCQGACDACVNNNNNNTNATTASPQEQMATATPTILPSTVNHNESPSVVPSPQPQPTTSSPVVHATPSKQPSQINNESKQAEGTHSLGTNNTGQEASGSNLGKKKKGPSSGSTATWVLSFIGVFLLVAAAVRVVGKKKRNSVTKKHVYKRKGGAAEGSSWIVTFLSGSLCSDISYDDDDE